jgi:hypothetical protein
MTYHTKHGDRICIDGYLWELTYSEMGPPGSRQATGVKCPECHPSVPGQEGRLMKTSLPERPTSISPIRSRIR